MLSTGTAIAELKRLQPEWFRIRRRYLFLEMVKRLKAFRRKHGHCNVSWQYATDPQFGQWVVWIRRAKRFGTLSNQQIAELDALGLDWNPSETRYREMIQRLKEFKKQRGHCNVPEGHTHDPGLAVWITTRRKHRRLGILSNRQITELDALGFDWNPFKGRRHEMIQRLKAFKTKNGHCNVPVRYPADTKLGRWAWRIRATRGATLSKQEISKLDALGFDWHFSEIGRQKIVRHLMVRRLKAFKKMNGHCNVPARYPADLKLGGWVMHVRTKKRSGTLSNQQIAELDAIGFDWNPSEDKRREMIQHLRAFSKTHGHCNVPHRYAAGQNQLGHWVAYIRRKKSEALSTRQVAELDALGFDWNPSETRRHEMVQRLKAFKKQHGHYNVPQRYTADPALAIWVATRRTHKRLKNLSTQQIAELDAIGFDWNPSKTRRREMVQRLKEFKKQHGHCNVTRQYTTDPHLGQWVSGVRRAKRSGVLPKWQIAELDAIGFDWNPAFGPTAKPIARAYPRRRPMPCRAS